jgi:hypothetical protein
MGVSGLENNYQHGVDILPKEWEAIFDPDSGEYYFANYITGETTWDCPPTTTTKEDVTTNEDDDEEEEEDTEDGNYSSIQLSSSFSPRQNNNVNVSTKLLPGWFVTIDEDSGDPYYCNEVTGETTWDPPTTAATGTTSTNVANDDDDDNDSNHDDNDDDDDYHDSLEVDDNDADDNNDMPSSWFAVVDPNSGDVYYCNEITGETTWDKPSSIRPSSRKEWDGKGGMITMDDTDEEFEHNKIGDSNNSLISRLTLTDTPIYEDDSWTSSR